MLFGIKGTESFLEYQQTFSAKTILFREGDICRETYILIKGSVEIYKENKLIATISTSGSFIGEMATLLAEPRSATIITKEKSVFIVLDENNFEALLKVHPIIGMKLAQSLAARLSITTKELISATSRGNIAERKFSMIELEANIPFEERIDILDAVVIDNIFSRTKIGYDYFKKELKEATKKRNSNVFSEFIEKYGVYDLYKEALSERYKEVLAIEKLTLTTERIKIDVPITFYITDNPKKVYVGKVKNISEGGLFFETITDMQINSFLTIKIFFPQEKKFVSIAGKIAWIRNKDQNGFFGIGVQFDALNERDKMIIERNMLYFVEKEI